MGFIKRLLGIESQQIQQPQPTTLLDGMSLSDISRMKASSDINKSVIPEFLYKPPYGYPRKANLSNIKLLAKNAYIYSIIKTLCDEVSSTDWNIRIKETHQDEGIDYSKQINDIKAWFYNPNDNEESFDYLLRQIITGVLEIDAGVFVKVFNRRGEFTQIFARDGATFTKNPDIHGSLISRKEYIKPTNPEWSTEQLKQMYDAQYINDAAYFQYGWTAGSMPIPFGRREVVYIMQNPRPDSIYGRAPLEVLEDVILTLIYGAQYNLGVYKDSNVPDGVISLLGAQPQQIQEFRDNFNAQFKFKDEFGKSRKISHIAPISNTEVKFTPFILSSKEMEILQQQEWFTKLVWMAFGVTSEEMGFTEQSNKAISEEQGKVFKRKSLKPLLRMLQYHINTQIMPEFFGSLGEQVRFRDIPLEFVFDDYDLELDKKEHELYKMQIDMGIKTPEMVAKEAGIDVDELKKQKKEARQQEMEMYGMGGSDYEDDEDTDLKARPHKYIRREGTKGHYTYYYDQPKINKEESDTPVEQNERMNIFAQVLQLFKWDWGDLSYNKMKAKETSMWIFAEKYRDLIYNEFYKNKITNKPAKTRKPASKGTGEKPTVSQINKVSKKPSIKSKIDKLLKKYGLDGLEGEEKKKFLRAVNEYCVIMDAVQFKKVRKRGTVPYEVNFDTHDFDGVKVKISDNYIASAPEFRSTEHLKTEIKSIISKLLPDVRKALQDGKTNIHFTTFEESMSMTPRYQFSPNTHGFYDPYDQQIYIHPPTKIPNFYSVDTDKMKVEGYSAKLISNMDTINGISRWNMTVVHEISHAYAMNKRPEDIGNIFADRLNKIKDEYDENFRNKNDRANTSKDAYKKFISRYARQDTDEDFAETFAYYSRYKEIINKELGRDSPALSKLLKEKFKFMRDVIWK